jgi:hypothetical protein
VPDQGKGEVVMARSEIRQYDWEEIWGNIWYNIFNATGVVGFVAFVGL